LLELPDEVEVLEEDGWLPPPPFCAVLGKGDVRRDRRRGGARDA